MCIVFINEHFQELKFQQGVLGFFKTALDKTETDYRAHGVKESVTTKTRKQYKNW